MLAVVPREELVRLLVVLAELLHDVLAHVAVLLLDLARDLELVLGRHVRHLAALAHEVEHELRDVAPGDGDVLDRAADDVPLRARDDVRDAVARVDDGAGERAVRDTIRGPRGGEREDGLHGDVEALDVEGLEEDLGRLLAVLGRVQWGLGLRIRSWTMIVVGSVEYRGRSSVRGLLRAQTGARRGRETHQEEVVVLGLRTKVLEDRLLPIPLHVVPVLDLTVADGVVDAIAGGLGVGEGFIADEEVEVLDASLGRDITGFGGKSGSARGLRSWATGCYRGGEDTGGRGSLG